jgi:hypothetical protein
MATVFVFFVVQGIYMQLPRKTMKPKEENEYETRKQAEE